MPEISVLPAVGNDGITRMVRACTEGPVFRGDLVRWDDVGTIPFDALGAPGWKPRPGAAPTVDTGRGDTSRADAGRADAGRGDTSRGGRSNAG